MRRLLLASIALILAAPQMACAQGAALLQKPIVAGNCSTLALPNIVLDSGVGCSSHQITISDGTHGTMQFAPSTFLLPNSAAILNNTSAQPILITRGVASTSLDGVDFDFRRVANYSGGTFGFVNSAARFYTIVSAGANSFEWPLLCVLDNSALAAGNAQDACGYFQAIKRGTSPTWAYVDELIDLNADPVAGSVTAEHDLRATGTDVHAQRVMADYFATSHDGNPATVTNGIRLSTDTHTTLVNGINLSGATISNAAIGLGTGQKLCLDGTTCADYISQSGGAIAIAASGVNLPATTATNLGIPSGNKLCLDGITCAAYISQASGTFSLVTPGGTSTVGGTAASFGNITSLSETSSGTVKGATLASTGTVQLPTGNKICFDGSTCSSYLIFTGSAFQLFIGGSIVFAADNTGTVASASKFAVGTTPGVNCVAGGSRQTSGGIVVIC